MPLAFADLRLLCFSAAQHEVFLQPYVSDSVKAAPETAGQTCCLQQRRHGINKHRALGSETAPLQAAPGKRTTGDFCAEKHRATPGCRPRVMGTAQQAEPQVKRVQQLGAVCWSALWVIKQQHSHVEWAGGQHGRIWAEGLKGIQKSGTASLCAEGVSVLSPLLTSTLTEKCKFQNPKREYRPSEDGKPGS